MRGAVTSDPGGEVVASAAPTGSTLRMHRVLPWILAAATVAAVGASVWIQTAVTEIGVSGLETLAAPAFALVGAVIVSRRGGHRVGWVLCGVGLAFSLHEFAALYGLAGMDGRDWPGAAAAAWYGHAGFVVWFLLGFVVLPLIYPDGELPSPRWRLALWGCVAMLVVGGLNSHARPTISPMGAQEVANPGRLEVLAPFADVTEAVTGIIFFPLLIAAVAGLVVRFRRSSGVERLQMKWFLAAAAVVPVGFAASAIDAIAPIVDPLGGLVLLAMPTAVGIAILRHRLYEIDRIISRTVTYVLVTVTLVAVYVTAVFGLGGLVRSLTGGGGGDLVVAASTLLVAALFNPVRRRAQHLVDRRFNRSRYDAQRMVAAFAQRLRQEVDLDVVRADLVGIAGSAVNPTHISAWLVDEAPVGSDRIAAPSR